MFTAVFFLAVLVGSSLGLVGSGGSILTVPILVYMLGIDPVSATGYSLFVVGVTSLSGGIRSFFHQKIEFKAILFFGIPSLITVYLTRAFLMPQIPEVILKTDGFQLTKSVFLMLVFAVIMVLASVSMIRPCKDCEKHEDDSGYDFNYLMIILMGSLVGIVTGLVGAGGGFLIIPVLVFFAKLPMKSAVGTSLFIIAINSAVGFIGFASGEHSVIDWSLLIKFSLLAVAGIFMGIFLSRKISGEKLKTGFGWFVLMMGCYILAKEIIL
ncbi:Sulfite exporter TauE/SafE [Chryseobacterium nakagawai]|uniref:Probable membrane transporter protein n=1 Tax=Chryseobacterium nakagawai TaxID=1241982 RepID=A0AAD0YQR5_CHRNA|nr:sulfite exporter TauE/SafE family protein [Chryseobacterium nakagawai]AZA92938.1 sulfite exporter TauE/SafE family protein [Chryseobacterium nakagawai]VEH19560.1 Sulfite exporter TauE/SafE [Chryseobacterium nakagawai]